MTMEKLEARLQVARNAIAKRSQSDITMSDGTIVIAGASHLPTLAKLDKVISLAKNFN